MSNEFRSIIVSLTGIFTSISVILVALEILEGVGKNSSNISTLIAFLLAWYAFAAVTEAVDNAITRILRVLGIPAFLVAFMISLVALLG